MKEEREATNRDTVVSSFDDVRHDVDRKSRQVDCREQPSDLLPHAGRRPCRSMSSSPLLSAFSITEESNRP